MFCSILILTEGGLIISFFKWPILVSDVLTYSACFFMKNNLNATTLSTLVVILGFKLDFFFNQFKVFDKGYVQYRGCKQNVLVPLFIIIKVPHPTVHVMVTKQYKVQFDLTKE